LPGVLTLLGIVGLVPLWEPLVGIFEGINEWHPGTLLNLVGLTALTVWSAVVLAALVTSLRARETDPTFRGVYSELVRTTALLLTLLVLATWITIDFTGAIEQPGGQEECVELGEGRHGVPVTRCRFRLK
jgi:hypothetical protein